MSVGKVIAIVGLVFAAVLILLLVLGVLPVLPGWAVLMLIGAAFAAILLG